MKSDNEELYENIINLPHPVSKKHKQMSLSDRAAQFASFAALTGYGEEISEVSRLTKAKKELTEWEISVLDRRLQYLIDKINDKNVVTITYYIPDKKKSGGEYCSVTDYVKKYNEYERFIVMQSEVQIKISEILYIEGEIFSNEW